MSIGGENRAGRVSTGNVNRMVEACGLAGMGITTEGCINLMSLYVDLIHERLEMVFEDLEKTSCAKAASELKDHIAEPITELCKRSKTRL